LLAISAEYSHWFQTVII